MQVNLNSNFGQQLYQTQLTGNKGNLNQICHNQGNNTGINGIQINGVSRSSQLCCQNIGGDISGQNMLRQADELSLPLVEYAGSFITTLSQVLFQAVDQVMEKVGNLLFGASPKSSMEGMDPALLGNLENPVDNMNNPENESLELSSLPASFLSNSLFLAPIGMASGFLSQLSGLGGKGLDLIRGFAGF